MRAFPSVVAAIILISCAPKADTATARPSRLARATEDWRGWQTEIAHEAEAMPQGYMLRLTLTFEVADDDAAARLTDLLRASPLIDSIRYPDSLVPTGFSSAVFGSRLIGRLRVTSHSAKRFDRGAIHDWLEFFRALPADSAWAVNSVGVTTD